MPRLSQAATGAIAAGHQRILGTRTSVSVGSTYSLRTGYAYDDAGQLTVAWVTNSAGTLVGGESRGYGYDFAQNLAKRTNSAGGSPVNAHANHLNQLTNGLGFNSYTHDRRGNLTFADAGSWAHSFTYDHENQCTSAGGYYGPYKSDYVYDGRGRLRKRTDWAWTGSSWYPNGEVRYLYDGMRVIQERTSAGHPAVTYTRGLDLSGTWEGAGGIGGLLARSAHATTTPYQPSTHACYHADGNGNVTYLLKSDRTHGASYKYDPYGRLITSSGTLASVNTLRFSSKEWHASASLYYYGYRFYVPELQRWLNRDPIGERGGINLYSFAKNSALSWVDPFGLTIHFKAGSPPEFVERWRKCICELMSIPSGRRLVERAAGPGTDIEISTDDSGIAPIAGAKTTVPPEVPQTGIGLDPQDPLGRAPYDDKGPPYLPDEWPSSCAVVLAHELGHASEGETDEGYNVWAYENPVRTELGYPPRDNYRGFPILVPGH